ncbi:prolyl oligopeptidase family serine peptidase [Gemmatimonadota bacterium]
MIRFLWPAIVMGSLMGPAANGQDLGNDRLSVDQLLSINSVVSGAPEWSPDGSAILFSSSFNGGLMTLSPEGGFPVRIPLNLGGAGHFLASQMPGWSPSGTWTSYVSNKSGSPEIWLWSTEDGSEIQLTNLGGRINSMSWSPDERWIVFAGDRYGNYDIWKVSVPGGDVYRLTTDTGYEVFPSWTPDSQRILYVQLDEAWVDHDVIEIDTAGEAKRTVLRDTHFFDYGAGSTFGYAQVSPDGETVLFRSLRSGWINYWTVPLAGGEPRQIAAADADQSDARWSPDGRWITFTENHNGSHDLRIVEARGGEPRVLVSPEMGRASSPAWSPDGRSIAYMAETITRPVDLFVVDIRSGEPRQLTYSMPAGSFEDRLVVPEKIWYQSTDGLNIAAYLYKPRAVEPGERFPGILWIHGGPTSQFHDTFQQHVQYFVDRGYVVLLPNIRGSSGYGLDFEEANNGCWGHCDLEDVLAGADYLKTLPYVNPNKLGITGTSYGGIMSMYAVSFAPGVFQASIPASGYADWVHFYNSENELRHVRLLDYELGPFETSQAVWWQASAISAVADVATPVFLVHGVGRYPGSDQSEIFAQGLENHYKPFRYKTYPNETYYVRGTANRRQMLEDMKDFFDQFLKDRMISPGPSIGLDGPTTSMPDGREQG